MKTKSKSKIRYWLLNLFFLLFCTTSLLGQEKTLTEMTIEELMNVKVITASTYYQNLIEAPATTYVITEEEIQQYGYRDLKDVLQHIPGIEYVSSHSNLQGGQRGFAENWSQTKLLINGRPVNKLWSGESYIASQYTLNNVKQIEIIQGPASALYGADAYTGVINIITKNNDNSKDSSDVSFALGSHDKIFDSKQVSFNIMTKKKNLGFTLSGTVFNQQGPDFTEFVRTPQYTFDNLQLRNDMLDNGNPYRDDNKAYNMNVDLKYSISANTDISGGVYFLKDEDGGGIESPEISYTNFGYISEQILTYLKFTKEFKSWPAKLTIDAFREDENDLVRFQDRVDQGNNPPFLAVFNIEGCKSHTINTQFDFTPTSIPNYLVIGVGYYNVSIGEPAFTGLSSTDSTLGNPIVGRYYYPPKGYFSNLLPYLDQEKVNFYIQDQHSFFEDKLQITLGARYDHHNIYGDITILRGGIYFKPIKSLSIKALYGEAFREPTMYEFTEGPNLKPAEMKTGELSLYFNPVKNIAVQLVYFQNHASMIIEEAPTIEDILVNQGAKTVEGLEGLIKWQFGKFRGNAWYNYERNPDDDNFVEIAKNKAGFGLIYNMTEKLSLSFQGKYTDKIKGYALDTDFNELIITIPEYKSFNFTFLAHNITFSKFPEIDFSFSIYNLFDTENLYPDVRGSNPSCYLEEGRSFYIKSTIHF